MTEQCDQRCHGIGSSGRHRYPWHTPQLRIWLGNIHPHTSSIVLDTCLGYTLRLWRAASQPRRSLQCMFSRAYTEVRKKQPRNVLRSSRVLVVDKHGLSLFGLRIARATGTGAETPRLRPRSVVIAMMRWTRLPTCEPRSTWS